MSIFASISKIGNIKSVSSNSIGSSGKVNGFSFGNNKSAYCECGGSNELIPLDAQVDVNAKVNPNMMSSRSVSCDCN